MDKRKVNIVSPINIVDDFGDSVLSCGCCKRPIIFPITEPPYDSRPYYCKNCGAGIDWTFQDEGGADNES